jgi:hypothetical protein
MRPIRGGIDFLLRAVLAAAASTWAAGRVGADALPIVDGVEFQPLSAQARRVAEAMDLIGQPLPPDARARLEGPARWPTARPVSTRSRRPK